ncbi:MAG TPA: hypothetical protein VD840_11110 [Sinorhizobium sp.]|nr:hypothetical protein [Sinorhizobium sp.]
MNGEVRSSWLDGPAARIGAILAATLAAAALTFLHRDDLFPSVRTLSPEEAAFAQCMSERVAGIEEMVRQKAITAEQEALFRSRAEALCRAQTAPAGLPPPMGVPALPQQ